MRAGTPSGNACGIKYGKKLFCARSRPAQTATAMRRDRNCLMRSHLGSQLNSYIKHNLITYLSATFIDLHVY